MRLLTTLITPPAGSNKRRRRTGFTFPEVLAAMVFMAIVIPVAIQGIRIAGEAATVAERKIKAARLAESALNEYVVSGRNTTSSRLMNKNDPWRDYSVSLKTARWPVDDMALATATVSFNVRNKEYLVEVSRLIKEE